MQLVVQQNMSKSLSPNSQQHWLLMFNIQYNIRTQLSQREFCHASVVCCR